MAAELEPAIRHSCNMCSYSTSVLQSLVDHVCRSHKTDPKFHVYCKSCLRSYTKWDSYRKHVQRGCESMPSSITQDPVTITEGYSGNDGQEDHESGMELEDANLGPRPVSRQWHDAAYILNIKEKYILSQAAIDQLLSATAAFVTNILSDLLNEVSDCVPIDILHKLEEKVRKTNDTLFNGVSTAFLQRKYFKQHFGLVVSYPKYMECTYGCLL